MSDKLDIQVDNQLVGNLIKEDNNYIFKYTSQNKNDFVSLTMQVRARDYINDKLHPVFEMHLPEGYLLSIIKKHFSKIAKTDDFGLLKLISSNIKARVNYKYITDDENKILTLDNLLYPQDDKLFDELVVKFALTSSLSGVQPKVLATIQNKATLTLEDYIVKSWGDDYPNLALNEYYCMLIVKEANIPVPEFYISSDHKLFIMKRFDIKEDGTYLGFEDMCVLQAKQRDNKYEGSYESIAKTIKSFVSSTNKKSSLKQFYKMIVINNLLKNGDAHLKNFGLIYDNIQDIKLSPAFDIVSTVVYIKNDISALNLLGSKKWWKKKFLIKFGMESCELSLKDANILYDECQNAFDKIIIQIRDKIKVEKDLEVKSFLEKLLQKWE